MKILFFINGHNQHRISRIKQSLCDFQPFLHHRQPFAMPIGICVIYIIVVIFPVPRASVVRRINVDTVHLAGIEVLEKLQSMVIVRLNERMPQVTVRCVLDYIHRDKLRIDGVAEFRYRYQFVNCYLLRLSAVFEHTSRHTVRDLEHAIDDIHRAVPAGNRAAAFDWDIIQRCAFRQVFLEHETELFLLRKTIHLGGNALTQDFVLYLIYKIVYYGHAVCPPSMAWNSLYHATVFLTAARALLASAIARSISKLFTVSMLSD